MSNVQPTSVQAYKTDVLPQLGERQRQVYAALASKVNQTNTEISRVLDIPINTVTPRVKELRELGLVIEDEERTCSVTGRRAKAWKVADQDAPVPMTPHEQKIIHV